MTEYIIGVDQSYGETGLSVTDSFKRVILAECVIFTSKMKQSEKRALIAQRVLSLALKYHPIKIVVERVRLFSSSRSVAQKAKLAALGKEDKHINTNVMSAHNRIIGSIIDRLYDAKLTIPVKSINTRDWKKAILGSAVATKEHAVIYVNAIFAEQKQRYPSESLVKEHTQSDNLADAVCLSLAGWNTRIKQEEER